MLTIWHKPYKIKRFTNNETTNLTIKLNVQPPSPQNHQNEPDYGEHTTTRLTSFGRTKLFSADEHTNQQADRLLYKGFWYECTSCVEWDHTKLAHFKAEWVQIPPYDESLQKMLQETNERGENNDTI
ncbi:MAG: hypothetical protein FWG64_05565 [Firmicutes bacterium]|nr:hypothetical protein [Bacillota bacterium]